MTKGVKSYGPGLLVPVIGAFAEIYSDADALADVTASALAADHTQFFSTSAAEAKGICTSSAPGRRGATQPPGDGPASCLTAAGTSLSMDPGSSQRRWQIRRLGAACRSGTIEFSI